ncbi:MAG: hypothetical protein AMXMBFR82_10230 [Candidatus Hydrogenedentota bacterium]
MTNIRVSCPCGNEMVMSEFAIGMKTTCPVCGKPLSVSWQNSRSLDSEAPTTSIPVSEEAARHDASLFSENQLDKPRAGKHHCDRCGREFRGDWDRHQTGSGTLCNICVNLVQQADPEDPSSGFVAPIDTMRLEKNEDPLPAPTMEPAEDDRSWLEKNWPSEETMQKVALYAGIAVVVLAALVFVTSGFDVPEASREAPAADTPTVQPVAGYVFYAVNAFTQFFGVFLGLYLFLSWSNRLPNDTFVLNLIALTPVAVAAALLWFVPIMGGIFVAILVFTIYGFEWGDLFRFPVASIVAGIFEKFLEVFLLGMLGILFT